MKVDLPKRVIQNVDDNASVSALAVESISSRLAAIGKLLPLVVRLAQKDVELVHHLRIWTRRASAALNLFRPLLPPKEYQSASKTIKQIRRAANTARDLDVMILEIESSKKNKLKKQLLKDLTRQRKKAQKSIDEVYRKYYRNDQWKRFTRRVISAIGSDSTGILNRSEESQSANSFSENDLLGSSAKIWAVVNLRAKLDDLLATRPSNDAKRSELHRFRIKAKQLKYTLELLSPFFPESFCKELTEDLSEIQERLGDYNDIRTAISLLKHHAGNSRGDARKKWEKQLSAKKRESKQMRHDLNQKLPIIFQDITDKLADLIPQSIKV